MQKIFDPCNGVDDLNNNILKSFDLKNFDDDPLRMLRAFRFVAQYNFCIDTRIENYIKNAKENIN